MVLQTCNPTLPLHWAMAKIPLQNVKAKVAAFDIGRLPRAPKVADAVYLTPEHRAWAKAVIRRDGFRCRMCGRTDGRMVADHVVEVKDGGAALDIDNGQCLCVACNTRKGLAARQERWGGGV